MIFYAIIISIILLRIGELLLSRNNEKWYIKNGGVEFGQQHYPFMITLHVLFFASMILECLINKNSYFNVWWLFLFIFITVIKIWVIHSLGRYFSTKIYRIPATPLIKKGLYKFFKHPNYMIVIVEIAAIPMIFNLYYTAIIFSMLNFCMLYIRIKEENIALSV